MNTEKLVIVPTQQAQMMQVDVIEDKGGKTFIETANSVSSYKKKSWCTCAVTVCFCL